MQRLPYATAMCARRCAALVYNEFLERKLEEFRDKISSGYTRGKISPARQASAKLDDWREIATGSDC